MAQAEGFRLESAGVPRGLFAQQQRLGLSPGGTVCQLESAVEMGYGQRMVSADAGGFFDWLAGGSRQRRGHRDGRAERGPGPRELPVSLEGGVSPTGLSRSEFGSKDFGTEIQFTSHVGLNWDFATHWRLSYRFQHMSNADLGTKNPGLNLNMLALSYVF